MLYPKNLFLVWYMPDNVSLSVSEPNEHCLTIEYLLDIPWIHHSYTFSVFTAPDLTAFQADMKRATGAVRLDLELLKPFQVSAASPDTIERSAPLSNAQRQLTVYGWTGWCKHHPVLHCSSSICWQPSSLSGLARTCKTTWGSLTRET